MSEMYPQQYDAAESAVWLEMRGEAAQYLFDLRQDPEAGAFGDAYTSEQCLLVAIMETGTDRASAQQLMAQARQDAETFPRDFFEGI